MEVDGRGLMGMKKGRIDERFEARMRERYVDEIKEIWRMLSTLRRSTSVAAPSNLCPTIFILRLNYSSALNSTSLVDSLRIPPVLSHQCDPGYLVFPYSHCQLTMDPNDPASFNHRTERLSTGRTYHFVNHCDRPSCCQLANPGSGRSSAQQLRCKTITDVTMCPWFS